MPAGVPKIAFKFRDADEATWVDLYHLVGRCRVIFMGQEITQEVTSNISQLLIFLADEDPTDRVDLLINSPGGELFSGLSIFNLITSVRPAVYTIDIGIAISVASLILAGGQMYKRIIYPHAKVMIHQPLGNFSDDNYIDDGTWDNKTVLDLREMVIKIYMKRTGQPYWVIQHDLDRDVYMSATEARRYGVVDRIIPGNFEQ